MGTALFGKRKGMGYLLVNMLMTVWFILLVCRTQIRLPIELFIMTVMDRSGHVKGIYQWYNQQENGYPKKGSRILMEKAAG